MCLNWCTDNTTYVESVRFCEVCSPIILTNFTWLQHKYALHKKKNKCRNLIPGSTVTAIRLTFYNLPGHRPTSTARSADQASSLTLLFDLLPHLVSQQHGLLVTSCRRCSVVFYTRIPARIQPIAEIPVAVHKFLYYKFIL